MFFGTGFALTSHLIAWGFSMTLGFVFVKLKGSYTVGFRFLAESPIIDFVRVDSMSDPLAAAAAEKLD
jgi:hypothetical protein